MSTVFITGANRGLGKGFVDYFAEKDDTVFAGMRNVDESMRSENVIPVSLDISDDNSIKTAFETVRKHTSSIDFIINNAGINKDSATEGHKELVCKLADLDRNSLMKMFDVNSVSSIILTKIFLPLLKSSSSWIINISSCRASFHDKDENGNPNYGYRASKIALNMFTARSIFDLPENIKTFAVHPGSVRSDMNPDGGDEPKVQAEKIISITKNWSDENNGKFFDYNGSLYPL